ncbi:MAG TPA: hypothetical protein VK168_13555 [Saprospiraceae bacterium]|nr:hypothetical protein [Saprospiraceae bacterium]
MLPNTSIRLICLLLLAGITSVTNAQNKSVAAPAPVSQVSFMTQPEPPSNLLYLETGTPIFLETRNVLDSKYLKEGQMVCLYVKYPVKVNGRVLVPAGREAWCRINRLVRPKGNGQAGMLEIEPMHLKTNSGQMLVLTGNPAVAQANGREIMAQALSAGTGVMGQQMAAVYQQQQMNRQMELDALIAYQQQKQLNLQQQQQMIDMQGLYLQNQDMQSRQMQMMQQQQLMQQVQMNPGQPLVVMPVTQQNPMAGYQQYPAPVYNNAPSAAGPMIMGSAPNPALMGVATALNIISPFISIMIKGKRAKIPHGYTMKTFVGYGLVLDADKEW